MPTVVDSVSNPEGLPIRSIEIVPLDVFEPVPDGLLSPVYRLVNRLHIRTRRSTVENQLLFAPGEPWFGERGLEQARNLRALDFLTPVAIEARRSDDSVDVRVVTRDQWTTSPEFQLESAGGKQYGSFAVTEDNLAGLGKQVAVSWSHDAVGVSQALEYRDPAVLGTRIRLNAMAGTGSDGARNRVVLGQTFYAQDVPRTYGFDWKRVTSDVVLYARAAEVARINQRLEETEIWWGFAGRRDSTIRRTTLSFFMHDRRLGPTTVLGPAPPELVGGEESERLRRFDAEMRLWRPRFVEVTGIDQMGVIEDFDLGASIALKAGYAPPSFGGMEEGYVRLRLDQGADTPFGFGWMKASVESRIRSRPFETLHRVDARWIYPWWRQQTLVLGGLGLAGLNMARDFQVVVGGLNGLRAYPIQALAGRRLWRFNVENRTLLRENVGQLVTIGSACFLDAARAWGSGATGTAWFLDGGVGLRLGAPQWTLGKILRIDVAWPLTPTRDGHRAPVFSIGSSQAF